MVTGSLQTKGNLYYIVLNVYPNNKRTQKWIPTTITTNGKSNLIKAEKLLADIRMIYNKNSCIDNKKTAEELLESQTSTNTSPLSTIEDKDNTEKLRITNNKLSNDEELIITKCLSSWYEIPKEQMVTSLMGIITENPNTNLIKRIITELVCKLSNDPREQKLKKMGKYRDMLFSDYIKEWLDVTKGQVRESTYKGYYDHVNGRMIPYFDKEEILLRDISLADIYGYIEYLYSENLKANTIKHHRSILSCIFTRAVEQELFEYNIINKLKSIKSDYYIANYYNNDELLKLCEIAKNTTIHLEVIIAAVYGLRREELLGLTWIAIDFKGKKITIKHTVQRFKIDGKTQFIFQDKTKTQSSYRTLPLFDFIANLLIEYKKIYAEYKKLFGNIYCTEYENYICLMPNGELMKPGYLSHTLASVLEDNNMKHIRLHDLRHSCATLLLHNNVPIKDIQVWLGHSNMQTTLNYAHLDETNKEIPAQVINTKFQNALVVNCNDEISNAKNIQEKLNDFNANEKIAISA